MDHDDIQRIQEQPEQQQRLDEAQRVAEQLNIPHIEAIQQATQAQPSIADHLNITQQSHGTATGVQAQPTAAETLQQAVQVQADAFAKALQAMQAAQADAFAKALQAMQAAQADALSKAMHAMQAAQADAFAKVIQAQPASTEHAA